MKNHTITVLCGIAVSLLFLYEGLNADNIDVDLCLRQRSTGEHCDDCAKDEDKPEACGKSIETEKDLDCIEICSMEKLLKTCNNPLVSCQCVNDNGNVTANCDYCCNSETNLPNIGRCKDRSWNHKISGKTCTPFRSLKMSKWNNVCGDCQDCFPGQKDGKVDDNCNDITAINECLYKSLMKAEVDDKCSKTMATCKCVEDGGGRKAECFWGCKDREVNIWDYYGGPGLENHYIRNETENANNGGSVCPECPSCIPKKSESEQFDVKQIGECIDHKLGDTYQRHASNCLCVQTDNGTTFHGECYWWGKEPICDQGNCIGKIWGSYGTMRELSKDIVACNILDEVCSTGADSKSKGLVLVALSFYLYFFFYFN